MEFVRYIFRCICALLKLIGFLVCQCKVGTGVSRQSFTGHSYILNTFCKECGWWQEESGLECELLGLTRLFSLGTVNKFLPFERLCAVDFKKSFEARQYLKDRVSFATRHNLEIFEVLCITYDSYHKLVFKFGKYTRVFFCFPYKQLYVRKIYNGVVVRIRAQCWLISAKSCARKRCLETFSRQHKKVYF